MKKIVIKLGGSCLGRPDVATRNFGQMLSLVKYHLEKGVQPIIVVSALAGETRRLQSMAENLFSDQQSKDQILAQGEMFATKLVSEFLSSQNIKAEALIGGQLPVYASANYGNAEIEKVDVNLIDKKLKNNVVPVIPGFVGRTKEGDIATLGFDGSDTSAVAVAAAMNVSECILYKDVQGIFSANPKNVPMARKWSQLPFEKMHLYASLGANILHERAVKTAWDANVQLRIVSFGNFSAAGTLITAKPTAEINQAVGVTYTQEKTGTYITVVGEGSVAKADAVMTSLAEMGTPINIMQMERHFIKFKLSQPEFLDVALQNIHTLYGLDNGEIASISNVSATDRLDPSLHSFESFKITG